MQLAQSIDKYRYTKYRLFKLRDELSVSRRLALAFVFACLTGLSALVRIPLPFTPVPVTGQVFAVLLSGIVLGGCYGGLSQIFYIGIGAMGLPWFSGGVGGLTAMTGITGGYIIGFVPAALLIGWLTGRYASSQKFHFQLLLMAGGVAIIYICGAVQLSIIMNTGLLSTAKLAVLPFIPVDLMKAVLAAGVSTALLPKREVTGN